MSESYDTSCVISDRENLKTELGYAKLLLCSRKDIIAAIYLLDYIRAKDTRDEEAPSLVYRGLLRIFGFL